MSYHPVGAFAPSTRRSIISRYPAYYYRIRVIGSHELTVIPYQSRAYCLHYARSLLLSLCVMDVSDLLQPQSKDMNSHEQH